MDPKRGRTGQDNDQFKSGDSYAKLFTLIRSKVRDWYPFAARPFDILTVVTPNSTNGLLKRGNDNNHNGFPYPWIRPFDGVMGVGERVVVANDPEGAWALGVLSNDSPATNTVAIAAGAHVAAIARDVCTMHRGFFQILTSATAPVSNEVLATVTFTTAAPRLPCCFVQAQGSNLGYGVGVPSATGFTILAPSGGLAASTAYFIAYRVEL